jgi:beta-mannosidase
VSSWAVIDSALRPKASYFYAKRFYAPILLTMKLNGERMEVWGTNDTLEPVSGTMHVQLLAFNGTEHGSLTKKVTLGANSAGKIGEFPVKVEAAYAKDEAYARARLMRGDELLAENRYFFVEPKHMKLPVPTLTSHVRRLGESAYRIDIHADRFAMDVRIEIDGYDAQFSDNYVDIDAGGTRSCLCTIASSLETVVKNLRIISLADPRTTMHRR